MGGRVRTAIDAGRRIDLHRPSSLARPQVPEFRALVVAPGQFIAPCPAFLALHPMDGVRGTGPLRMGTAEQAARAYNSPMSENNSGTESPPAASVTFADLGLAPEIPPRRHRRRFLPVRLPIQAKPSLGASRPGTSWRRPDRHGQTAAFSSDSSMSAAPREQQSFPARHPVRALILAPTRGALSRAPGLESVKAYSKHTPCGRCAFGGVDIEATRSKSEAGYRNPGRHAGSVLDHVEQKSVSFAAVQALVLDEADRMLDMGFIPDVTTSPSSCHRTCQSLLFPATFSGRNQGSLPTRCSRLGSGRGRQAQSGIRYHRPSRHPVSDFGKRGLLVRKTVEIGKHYPGHRFRSHQARMRPTRAGNPEGRSPRRRHPTATRASST